jgi:hypothetical protein
MPRHSELSHDENFERGLERRRHFIANGNSAARQCKDDHIASVREFNQLFREYVTRFAAIPESPHHDLSLPELSQQKEIDRTI